MQKARRKNYKSTCAITFLTHFSYLPYHAEILDLVQNKLHQTDKALSGLTSFPNSCLQWH